MNNIDIIPDLDEVKKQNLLKFAELSYNLSGIKIDILDIRKEHLIVRVEHIEWKGQFFSQTDLVKQSKSLLSKFTHMPMHFKPLTLKYDFSCITREYVLMKMKEHKLKNAEIGKAINLSKEETKVMLKSGEDIPTHYKPTLFFYLKMWDLQIHYAKNLSLTAKMLTNHT